LRVNSASTNTLLANGRRRFLKDRVKGLLEEGRPGRQRTINDDQVTAVIERTLRSRPKDAMHWFIDGRGWFVVGWAIATGSRSLRYAECR